jgi:hypothetical protein
MFNTFLAKRGGERRQKNVKNDVREKLSFFLNLFIINVKFTFDFEFLT